MRPLAGDVDIASALTFIVGALRKHRVPFQVVGGLAAHAYGGQRPVVDLDFYAPLADAGSFLDEVSERTVWGPEHYRDESWDLRFMKIDHGPVRIEIGDTCSDPKFFDQINRCWVRQRIDFVESTPMTVFGVLLPVMPSTELVAYKTLLNRPVDIIDIREITDKAAP